MSPSRFTKTCVLTISAILCLVAWPASSGAQVSNKQVTVLTKTRDFLKVAYPELFGKGMFLRLETSQGIDDPWRTIYGIRFLVLRFDPLSERMLNPPFDPKTGKRLSPPENFVFNGTIRFDPEGHLHQFSACACDFVHDKENQAIAKLVESHPEWSEAQAIAVLEKAGARYGPDNKDEFVKAIGLERYEPFLGHFTVKSAEFAAFTGPHEGNFASLEWWVELDVGSSNGAQPPYTLIFEPFSGKLTEVFHGIAIIP